MIFIKFLKYHRYLENCFQNAVSDKDYDQEGSEVIDNKGNTASFSLTAASFNPSATVMANNFQQKIVEFDEKRKRTGAISNDNYERKDFLDSDEKVSNSPTFRNSTAAIKNSRESNSLTSIAQSTTSGISKRFLSSVTPTSILPPSSTTSTFSSMIDKSPTLHSSSFFPSSHMSVPFPVSLPKSIPTQKSTVNSQNFIYSSEDITIKSREKDRHKMREREENFCIERRKKEDEERRLEEERVLELSKLIKANKMKIKKKRSRDRKMEIKAAVTAATEGTVPPLIRMYIYVHKLIISHLCCHLNT
jgi:hypothetical protein